MHQVQLGTCILEMQELHCSIICLPATMMETLLFVLRILTKNVNIEDGEKSQLENLAWLGMDWDESPENPGEYGPYRQSERKEIYQPLIDQLHC